MEFNLHSIINSGFILGGQNSSNRQTVFFVLVDPRDKGHQDPATIDFNKPRRAQYLQSAWKKHQDAVFWVDINLALRKGLTFYQTRSNAIILQETLPAYCIPIVVTLKTGEVLYEKSMHVTSTSTKDLTTSRLDKRIGLESCSTTRRDSCSTARRRSCSTSKTLPTSPINSKSKL